MTAPGVPAWTDWRADPHAALLRSLRANQAVLAYCEQLDARVDDIAGTGNDTDEAQAEAYAEVAEKIRRLIGAALETEVS
jgi:hypothetical protein